MKATAKPKRPPPPAPKRYVLKSPAPIMIATEHGPRPCARGGTLLGPSSSSSSSSSSASPAKALAINSPSPAAPPAELIEIKGIQLIECTLCYVPYGDNCTPVMMQCGHSICHGCLKSVTTSTDSESADRFLDYTVRCPTCLVEKKYDFYPVLPINFDLLGAQQAMLLAMATCESYAHKASTGETKRSGDELAVPESKRVTLDQYNDNLFKLRQVTREVDLDRFIMKADMAITKRHKLASWRNRQLESDASDYMTLWFDKLSTERAQITMDCQSKLNRIKNEWVDLYRALVVKFSAMDADDPSVAEDLAAYRKHLEAAKHRILLPPPTTLAQITNISVGKIEEMLTDLLGDVCNTKPENADESSITEAANQDIDAIKRAEPLIMDRVKKMFNK
jgi:hypothetical protein